MTSYQCGDIVLCNGLTGKGTAGYAIVVTNNKSLKLVMVYQFININDHNYANTSINTGAFINMLLLIRDNKGFNIFKDSDKATFIDIESFFKISDIEVKSYSASYNSGMVTKLSTVTRENILIPNGLMITHTNLIRHEVVGCKDNEIATITPYDGSVYEHKAKDVFMDFKNDVTIDMINKSFPLTRNKELSIIPKVTLKNLLKTRRKK